MDSNAKLLHVSLQNLLLYAKPLKLRNNGRITFNTKFGLFGLLRCYRISSKGIHAYKTQIVVQSKMIEDTLWVLRWKKQNEDVEV